MINIEPWLAEKGISIEQALQMHINTVLGYDERDERTLPLSDLHLCGAIASGAITFPPPFETREVTVRIDDRRISEPHNIGLCGREVIDVVPGQFFANETADVSGVAYMLSVAPDLFHVVSDELVVLHATMKQIKDAFGIDYIPNT